jgi:hypothetical protein
MDFYSYAQSSNWIALKSCIKYKSCKIQLDLYARYYASDLRELERKVPTVRTDIFFNNLSITCEDFVIRIKEYIQ